MAFSKNIGSLVKRAVSSNPSIFQAMRYMSSSKLFVGGLSYSTDDQSLREAFSEYGAVTEARVIMDRETGRSRGFGFVSFTSTEEASAAMSQMDGKDLHGRMVRVNYATERTGGNRGGYGGGGYGGGGYSGGGGGYGGGDYSGGGGYGGGGYSGGGSGYGGGGYSGGGGGGYGGGAGNYGDNTFGTGGSTGGGVSPGQGNNNAAWGSGGSDNYAGGASSYGGYEGSQDDMLGDSFKDEPQDYVNKQG